MAAWLPGIGTGSHEDVSAAGASSSLICLYVGLMSMLAALIFAQLARQDKK